MRFARLRVKLQGTFGGLAGLGLGVNGRCVVVSHLAQESVSAGQPRICQGVVWFLLDGLPIGVDALVQVAAIGPVEPAAKISIVGFGIDGARRSSGPIYAGSAHRKRYANMACHGGGNFILNTQDIANVAGVRVGPQMRLVAHLNKLDINPDLIAASTPETLAI